MENDNNNPILTIKNKNYPAEDVLTILNLRWKPLTFSINYLGTEKMGPGATCKFYLCPANCLNDGVIDLVPIRRFAQHIIVIKDIEFDLKKL